MGASYEMGEVAFQAEKYSAYAPLKSRILCDDN